MKHPEREFSPATPIAFQAHIPQEVEKWTPAQLRKRKPVVGVSVMEGSS